MKHNNIITHLTKAALCVPFIFAGSATAEVVLWNTNDGDFGTASNWDSGSVPGSADDVRFGAVEGLDNDITVGVDGVFETGTFRYSIGKNVTLNMADGASITSGLFMAGNYSSGPSGENAASSFTMNGAGSGTATFDFAGTSVGASQVAKGVGGTTITFSGPGLTVNATAQITHGRDGWENSIILENGATLNAGTIWIGDSRNGLRGDDNRFVVRGAGTTVNQEATSGINAFRISGRTNTSNGTSSDVNNRLVIEDGGVYNFNGAEGSDAAKFSVADISQARTDNYVLVTGAGSELNIGSNANVQIGRYNISNNYDNYIRVEDGGTITSEGKISVFGQQYANRFEVGNGGTLTVNNTIEVNQGTFRLENGGILNGNATVEVGGILASRFEVAGSGLASTVEVNINKGGVFAVGIGGATEASTATITSVVNLYGGSTLELTVFGRNSIDSIELGIGSQLNIEPDLYGDGVVLSILTDGYTLAAGDTFTLFTGETQNIAGEFANMVLPTLTGDLEWDLTAFNEAGGWTVAVIPEPGTYAMFAGAGALLLVFLRRRKA